MKDWEVGQPMPGSWPRTVGADMVRSETMVELCSILRLITGSFAAPAADHGVMVECGLAV
jgi:hypothetical protein